MMTSWTRRQTLDLIEAFDRTGEVPDHVVAQARRFVTQGRDGMALEVLLNNHESDQGDDGSTGDTVALNRH